MKNRKTKFILLLLVLLPFVFAISAIKANAQQTYPYVPLAPIGNKVSQDAVGKGLSSYINSMYQLGVGIATALAVIMIMWGGITYMTTDAIGGKEEAKEKINNAFLGLFIALGSYLILKTINQDLINTNLDSRIHSTKPIDGAGPATNPVITGAGTTANANGTNSNNSQTDAGTILANVQEGMTFPDQSWNDAALQQIQNSGLLDLSPGDATKYFGTANPTAENYLSLLAAIANSESSFNPADNTTAHNKDGNSSFSSEGLLSLSVGDGAVGAVAKKYQVSPQDVLNSPTYSIEAGVQILKNNIQRNGVINNGTNSSYWGPLIRNQ